MSGLLLFLGGLAGLSAVAMGAFGAHALKDIILPDLLPVYQTGALYHLVHAVVLLITALLAREAGAERLALAAGLCFAVGIVIFSGSLYLLAITGTRWLGAITPIGGLAFMVGWAILIWAAIRNLSATP